MTSRVPVLTPAQEDVIITSRLFNDERPLRRTVKKIVTLQTPQPPATSASTSAEGPDVDMAPAATTAEASSSTSELTAEARQRQVDEDVWDSFNLQLRDTEFLVKKAAVVGKMEEKMRGEYEAKGREIDESQTQLRAEVSSLRHQLELAQEERKHKMEYDAIALKILAVGSRQTLEADIASLADRVASLQAEQTVLASSLLARKSRFDSLLEELESIRKVGTEEEAAPVVEEEAPEPESVKPSRVASPAAEEGENNEDEDDEEADGRREVKQPSPKKKTAVVEPEPQQDDEADGLDTEDAGDAAEPTDADVDMQAAEELDGSDLLASAAEPEAGADVERPATPHDTTSTLSSLPPSQLSDHDDPVDALSPAKRKASQSPTASASTSALPSRNATPTASAAASPLNPVDPSTEDPTTGMTRSERAQYLAAHSKADAAASSDAPSAPSSSSNKRQRLSNSPAPPSSAKRVTRRTSETPAAEEATSSMSKGKTTRAGGAKAKAVASVKGGAGKKGQAADAKDEEEVEEGEDSDLTAEENE